MAQVVQVGNGQITLAWLSTDTTDAGSTDQAPQLIEDLSSSSCLTGVHIAHNNAL